MMFKKGLVLNALMRIIIAIVTLFFVFKACTAVADVFTGTKGYTSSFSQFVDEVNTLKNLEAREAIVTLPEASAIIGFAKSTDQFRCIGCGNQFSSTEYFFEIPKPDNEACKTTSCACLCFDASLGEQSQQGNFNIRPFNCEQASCKKITHDIMEVISLEKAVRDQGRQLANYPKWEGGFIFIRSDDISNGYKKEENRRFTVAIERQDIGGGPRVAACPVLPCFPQDVFT